MSVTVEPHEPHRILIVEDNAEVRHLVEREIADRGHTVVAVADAQQAMVALQEQCYSVVVTDLRMPGMDGVELTRWIKERALAAEVIIITGYGSIDNVTAALRLGVVDFLTKPFGDITRVAAAVDRALERYSERRNTEQLLRDLLAQHGSLLELLDRLPQAIVLCDASCRAILLNQSARSLVASHELYVDDQHCLGAGTAEETRRLRELVIEAALDRDGRSATLLLDRGDSPTLSLTIVPLRSNADGLAVAAVFLCDPRRRATTTEEMLADLYGLTPAEARLSSLLMSGRSIDEAAQELSITANTARTHLKHVFAKTHTSRQGELVSLLLCGPALLQPPDVGR
jgi:FixJ family two-component response regulator